MRIDWTKTETEDLQPIAEDMAAAAELNLGLPFALVVQALDDAGVAEETRAKFFAELGSVAYRCRTERVQNA